MGSGLPCLPEHFFSLQITPIGSYLPLRNISRVGTMQPPSFEVQGVPIGRRLGWVVFFSVPLSAWANGNMAELAGQVDKMVKHQKKI